MECESKLTILAIVKGLTKPLECESELIWRSFRY